VKGTRRHRYIAFHVEQEEWISCSSNAQLIHALRQQAAELFSKTLKDLGLWVIQFNGTDGIVKCHYIEKDHVIQLLLSIKKIGDVSVNVTTEMTSGTIQGLSKEKLKKEKK